MQQATFPTVPATRPSTAPTPAFPATRQCRPAHISSSIAPSNGPTTSPIGAQNNPTTVRTRLTNAHDWAKTQPGIVHGFPNFHEANYGAGVVYGTFLLTAAAVTWQDVPVATILGANIDPTTRPMEQWFTGANDWAMSNGKPAAIRSA